MKNKIFNINLLLKSCLPGSLSKRSFCSKEMDKNNSIQSFKYLGVLLIILFSGFSFGQAVSKKVQRPNIVFVFADQWRAQSTGFAGNPDVVTPTIDKLAEKSVVFTKAVANMPVCCPYRASLLTGQYPLTHGVFMNDVRFDPNANTMGKIFKAAGYNTAYIGKWHLDGNGRSAYIPPNRRHGFDYWKVLECTHNYNNSLYYSNNDTIPSRWSGYDAHAQTLDAMNYIREHANTDQPFLLVLSWGPPHAPYQTAPEKYREKYRDVSIRLRPNVPSEFAEKAENELKGYYAHINALDDYLDMLLTTLERENIDENTIFVFTSDHGDMIYSQGKIKKQQPYDESIRVPFLLRYPEIHQNTKKLVEEPFGTPDILPTLLGLANIDIPKTIEGNDYSDVVKGKKKGIDNAALISCVTPFGQWGRNYGGVEYRGLRTSRYTYTRKLDGPWLLFDNEKDPYQQNNLIGNPGYSKIQRKLERELKQKLRKNKDEFLPGEKYIKRWGYEVDETGTIPYEP